MRGQRGSVEDRWTTRSGERSANHGKGSRWRARYVDAASTEHQRNFTRKADAERWLSGKRSTVVTGTHVAAGAGRALMDGLLDDHLASKRHLTAKAYESLRSIVDARLRPVWAQREVAAVLPSDVQRWISDMVAAGLSSSRVRQSFHTLQAVFAIAVRDRRIAVNPCTGVDVPKLITTQPHRYLKMTELLTLARAAGDDSDVVLMLGLLGLRWGELVGLQVGDIDLQRRRVRVLRSTSEVGGRLIDNPVPKTNQRREIGIPDVLLGPLAARSVGKLPAARLITTDRGATLRSRNWRRDVFDPAVADAGLDGLTIHQLRHTAASLAIANGASVLSVARMLGHADPSVTLRVYAHLFDSELDALAGTLAGAVKIAAGDLRAMGPR